MRILLWLYLLPFGAHTVQTYDMSKIRGLYQHAPEFKKDAVELNDLMHQVDSGSAAPVLVCYKGANQMIQAKYHFNPFTKFEDFNTGKVLIQKAIARDKFNLEIHFIRYSIQSNLPAFLGYHDDLKTDKQFLLNNTKSSKDPELKKMIFDYLSGLSDIKPDELKQLKN